MITRKIELFGTAGDRVVVAWTSSGTIVLRPGDEFVLVWQGSEPVLLCERANAAVPAPERHEPRRRGRKPSVANGGLLVCNHGHDLRKEGTRRVSKKGTYSCVQCDERNQRSYIERQHALLAQGEKKNADQVERRAVGLRS